MRENLGYFPLLHDLAVVQNGNMLANSFDNTHLVSYYYNRYSQFFIYTAYKFENRVRCVRIKSARSLVAKQYFGLRSKGAGNRDPLLLTSRQLRGISLCLISEPYDLKQFKSLFFRFRFTLSRKFQRETDVFQTVSLHQQIKALKYRRDFSADFSQFAFRQRFQPQSVYFDTSGTRPFQHIYTSHEGTFPRTAHADDPENITVGDGNGNIFQRVHRTFRRIELFGYVFQFDHTQPPQRRLGKTFALCRAVFRSYIILWDPGKSVCLRKFREVLHGWRKQKRCEFRFPY